MPRASKKTVKELKENNKKHKLTKKELEALENSVVKIGSVKFDAPESVKSDPVAFAKWKEIMKLYKDCDQVDIVSSADIGLLERYSLMYSDYKSLLDAKKKIYKALSLLEALEACNKLKIDSEMNAKSRVLLQMESELFLTPLSKSRAMPRKKHKKEKSNLQKKGFKLG